MCVRVCVLDLVADLPEGREGVLRVPQFNIVWSMEGEEDITHIQGDVGQGLVL